MRGTLRTRNRVNLGIGGVMLATGIAMAFGPVTALAPTGILTITNSLAFIVRAHHHGGPHRAHSAGRVFGESILERAG